MRSAHPEGDSTGYDSEGEREFAFRALGAKGHVTRHMETKMLRSKRADVLQKASTLADVRASLSVSSSKPTKKTKRKSRKPLAPVRPIRSLFAVGHAAEDDVGDIGSGDDDRSARGSSSEEGEEEAGDRGVRLVSRALSFSQVSRIYGKQKKQGLL